MSVQRNLWTSWLCTAGVLVVGAFPSVGLCQSTPDQVVENTPTDPIEEIIVYGEKSLPSLHREVYRTEEKFFAVFNTLNDDDEYDIHCDYEIPPFTHIRKHVCRANFIKDATAADYAGWATRATRRSFWYGNNAEKKAPGFKDGTAGSRTPRVARSAE